MLEGMGWMGQYGTFLQNLNIQKKNTIFSLKCGYLGKNGKKWEKCCSIPLWFIWEVWTESSTHSLLRILVQQIWPATMVSHSYPYELPAIDTDPIAPPLCCSGIHRTTMTYSVHCSINGHFRNLNWRYLPYIRSM